MASLLQVEICYASPTEQCLKTLEVAQGSTVLEVIQSSGLLEEFPEIDALSERVGIFGRSVSLETVVKAGDRVEIYRALLRDPKETRRLRAQKYQSIDSKR